MKQSKIKQIKAYGIANNDGIYPLLDSKHLIYQIYFTRIKAIKEAEFLNIAYSKIPKNKNIFRKIKFKVIPVIITPTAK